MAESSIAVSRDGDPSANALSGLRWFHRALRLRAGCVIMKFPARSGSTSRAAGPWSHGPSSPAEFFSSAHWAYSVLGWGGYWGWDPVETHRSCLAHRHCFPALGNDAGEARMLKMWNMWLVFATFWLAILGTFLTRSGIISSVHAFAPVVPSRYWLPGFLADHWMDFCFFSS